MSSPRTRPTLLRHRRRSYRQAPLLTPTAARSSSLAADSCPTARSPSASHTGDDIVDYLTYLSDADGRLSAALPETAVTETGHITVTDQRPDPAGDRGLLWSNTVIVTHTGG